MISGMTVILSKPFVHPSPSGFLTTYRSPSLLSRPICSSLNFKYKQIGEASFASAMHIFVNSSRRFSRCLNYDSSSNKSLSVKSYLKSWREEVRFDQVGRSKDFPARSLLSLSAVRFELAPFGQRKERGRKGSLNSTAAGHGDRNYRSSFSVDEELRPLSSEQKRVPRNFKISDSEALDSELPGSEQSVIDDRFTIKKGRSEVARGKDSSEQRTDFDQWAVNKLREDGLSSLTIIEDMRQTFAPGSAPLDPKLLFSEAEFQELGSRAIADKIVHPNIKRSNHFDKKSFSTLTIMPTNRKPPVRSLDERTSVKQTEESRSNVAGSPHPKPLLVKRKTSLPENWNPPGGTVVLVDKPQGWTSFAVCGKLRHTLKIQKVGHAGTLDPMATGLLIVCLGRATKLADSYQAMTKVYSGVFRLGEDTPSLDADTEVSATLPWEHIRDEDIASAKQAFVGDILQSPPMYSAIKIKGERLYAKARRGEEVEVPARTVTVHEFDVNRSANNRQEFHFTVTCSKGTYVRSLCSDLGRALGSYAHLTALRRERIGTYSVSDAWPVEELVENYNQQCRNSTSRIENV